MVISSLLLALNLQRNFDKLAKAQTCVICVVDESISFVNISEIDCVLKAENIGEVLPIYNKEEESAFSVILKDLDKGIKIIKRLLWEFGVLLSTKIVLVQPEIELLKDYGEGA